MNTVIYKYGINLIGRNVIELPKGYVIRHVGEQLGSLCVWIEITIQSTTKSTCVLEVFATGEGIPAADKRNFIGTVQKQNGTVWHIFERIS